MMLLDSLGDAYVRRGDAPFYSSRVSGGSYAAMESLFAFEGVMAAALTGRWPDETGVFARFAYGPEESVMRRNPLRILNLIDRHAYYANGERRDGNQNFILVKAIRKALRKWWWTGGFNNLSPYGGVPLAVADRFRYCMVLGAFDQTLELAGFETIFGKCRRLGLKKAFHYGELPRARAFLEGLGELSEYGVILLHTWTQLDLSGHEFGPHSEEIRAMVRRCDGELREFVTWLESRLPDASFVMFADHGMDEVRETMDVTDIVEEAIDGKGPTVFVDSTAVRAWGKPEELGRLADRLSAFQGAVVLSDDDLRARHAYFPDAEYGQLFVVAEPGYIFIPDYFEGWKPRKGMHGYFRDTEWLRPSLAWYGPAFESSPVSFQPAAMPDVFRLADHALDARARGGT